MLIRCHHTDRILAGVGHLLLRLHLRPSTDALRVPSVLLVGSRLLLLRHCRRLRRRGIRLYPDVPCRNNRLSRHRPGPLDLLGERPSLLLQRRQGGCRGRVHPPVHGDGMFPRTPPTIW